MTTKQDYFSKKYGKCVKHITIIDLFEFWASNSVILCNFLSEPEMKECPQKN